ncbi:Swi5-domain-containing protein [Cercophora scortea]|uniref:Swi5-domain-containing protein n=1 Tax=Cercophora scortea TaxID=314031 RepID=A0AAE0IPG3_9PEZI|nr:Swi5-domain-containing protein [Cercophora scortea]
MPPNVEPSPEDVDNESIDEPTILVATVRAQLALVDSFRRWMHEDLKDEWKKYGDIFSTVSSRLDSYRQWLLDAEQNPTSAVPQPVPWGVRARVQPGSSGLTILVTGTRPNDQFEIFAKDKMEVEYLLSDRYFGCISKMCQGFSQAEKDIATMLQIAQETEQEQSKLSQAPELTTQTHIRLLKEYNDIKDIGQQLIGLVAENKGVRIGTLYESGQYGVETED